MKQHPHQSQKSQAPRARFPIKMFATAGICSVVMVMVISAVFAQANAPCIISHGSQDKVIVDTTHSSIQYASNHKGLAICNRNNQQIGWLTWLFKRSDSVEFHYLDLLELLSRNDT